MDYYTVLGISHTASTKEIKDAYRKKALAYHPDRFCKSNKEEQQLMSIKFKEMSEAYKILVNDCDRATYDRSGRSGVRQAWENSQRQSSGYGHQQYDPFKSTYSTSKRHNFWKNKGFSSWSEFSAIYGRQLAFHTVASITLLGVLFLTSSSAEWIWNTANRGKTFEDYLEAREEGSRIKRDCSSSHEPVIITHDPQLKSTRSESQNRTSDTS